MDSMQPKTSRASYAFRWIAGLALGVAVGAGAIYFIGAAPGSRAAPEDPHAQVALRAAERLAGARCIGARASAEQKDAIARMLALNTLAPRGALPSWLPDAFATPAGGPDGVEAWQTLASACPDAPAFGTPFGFPSTEIEKELRADPAFAAASDRHWAAIRRYENAAR